MSGVHQPLLEDAFSRIRTHMSGCVCYGRIRLYAALIADEIHVLQYARFYGVFEMVNVDKMEHFGSSGDRFQTQCNIYIFIVIALDETSLLVQFNSRCKTFTGHAI